MKRYYPALALSITAILAYGLILPSLGFYWDDLPMSWIRYQLGPEAMTRYFSSNRPVWGMLYQVTTRILPHIPIYWQVFALLLRALTGILVLAVVRRIWREREIFALVVAFFFLLYPGFNQQWGSYLYSHFFIVINFFLASLHFNLRALDEPRRARLFTGLALLFSALNLWMMEYFFFLELVRPFVVLIALVNGPSLRAPRSAHQVLRRALFLSVPYLALWLAAILWRMFIFNNQVYSTPLIDALKVDFLAALTDLTQMAIASFWTVNGAALGQIFQLPDPSLDGWRVTAMVAGVGILIFALAFRVFCRANNTDEHPTYSLLFPLSAIGLSLLAFLTAGWPLWLIEFPPSLAHPASRFTLPFMFGASLLWGGLLELIPRPRWKYVFASLLVALMAGRQSFWMNDYRREWEAQKTLFWQMTWRAPGLEPNTTVLLNDRAFLSPSATGILPPEDLRVFNFYADNSLAATLNWVYAPGDHSDKIPYLLLYPKSRIGGSLPSFEKGRPIPYDFLAGAFEGNTSQVVAFFYAPPGCLRLLDPEIDPVNRFIPDETLMREAAALSSSAWITPGESARMPMVYGSEPERGWCYYFEKADLAHQRGDWAEVVRLGEIAFGLDDYPNHPVERFVFIEGYAHIGDWARAQELSLEAYRVSKDYVGPMLCRLWDRIEAQTPHDVSQQSAVGSIREQFSCAR